MAADPVSIQVPQASRSSGRAHFWAALSLCVVGIVFYVIQSNVLKQLVVPWYIPLMTTVGAALLVFSIVRRRTIVRFVALFLVVALAGFEWYALSELVRLPAYSGTAQVGLKLPPFSTTLADGKAFTERDLELGSTTVLVFYRGRW